VQAWYWILGDYQIPPTPGQEIPRRWTGYKPETGQWKLALFASVKYEHTQININQFDTAMLNPAQQAALGGMTVDVAEVALNLWLSKHIRFQANYVLNYLDGDMQLAQKNPFYQTPEHEVLLRGLLAM
jgi:hypothetical protein